MSEFRCCSVDTGSRGSYICTGDDPDAADYHGFPGNRCSSGESTLLSEIDSQESYAAMFSAGMSSACVVDVGATTTSVTCVDEGVVAADTR